MAWSVPRIEILPLGAGFRVLPARSSRRQSDAAASCRICSLCIHARAAEKSSHSRARWSRLIEKHGAENIPSLVFAGRRGWMIDDLLIELEQSGFLAGKIILLSDLSDIELREVYRRCLFSVFPSFVEGWGLPVAESLEQGKLCIASNRASIPEVGGDLVDYVDPDDETGMLAAIERAIFDDAYRDAREARIRAEYRPTSWARCVEVLMSSFDRISESSPGPRPLASEAGRRSLPIGDASS